MSFAQPVTGQDILYTQLALVAPYLAVVAFVLAIAAVVMLVLLRRRLARLALGRNGSIEESIHVLLRENGELKAFRAELEKYLQLAETRLRKSVSGVGVVRFNPYEQGQGGNQSFAIALLDERGHGVVLSTLYARDRVGVYAKPVQDGASTFDLTPEEKDAIAAAQKQAAEHVKKRGR